MTKAAKERTKRTRFLPYAHERLGISCRIDRVEFEGTAELDSERQLVSIEATHWDTVTLHGALVIKPDVLERVFPESERSAPPGTRLLVLRGRTTRVRRAIVVGSGPLSSDPAPFVFTVRRAEMHGTLELHSFLVRGSNAAQPTAGFAHRRGTRLTSGRPWSIRADRLHEPDGKFLDTRYRRFSADAELRAHADTLFRLEMSESPVLWINSDHERVLRAFDDRGTRGPKARIRDVGFDLVAQSVWTQMFVQAALDLQQGDLVYDWEDSVLRELLPGLMPGRRSHAARLEALRSSLVRHELPELLGQLATLLQRRHQVAGHLERLVEDAAERRS